MPCASPKRRRTRPHAASAIVAAELSPDAIRMPQNRRGSSSVLRHPAPPPAWRKAREHHLAHSRARHRLRGREQRRCGEHRRRTPTIHALIDRTYHHSGARCRVHKQRVARRRDGHKACPGANAPRAQALPRQLKRPPDDHHGMPTLVFVAVKLRPGKCSAQSFGEFLNVRGLIQRARSEECRYRRDGMSPQCSRPGSSRCPGLLRKNVTVSLACTAAPITAPVVP